MSLGVAAVLVAVGLWFVWRRIYLTRLKRWLETLEQAQISEGTDPSRIYRVVFSSLFLPDQFGFVRAGVVAVSGDAVVLSGRKSWPALAKIGAFLVLSVGVRLVTGFGVAPILSHRKRGCRG